MTYQEARDALINHTIVYFSPADYERHRHIAILRTTLSYSTVSHVAQLDDGQRIDIEHLFLTYPGQLTYAEKQEPHDHVDCHLTQEQIEYAISTIGQDSARLAEEDCKRAIDDKDARIANLNDEIEKLGGIISQKDALIARLRKTICTMLEIDDTIAHISPNR